MMKERIYLVMCMLALCGSIHAQHATVAQRTVSIYQKDGQIVSFAFTERPVVTYEGNDLVLTTTKTTVQFPIYLLKKLQFDEDWVNSDDNVATAIEQKEPDVLFGFHDGTLTISGGTPNTQVTLAVAASLVVPSHSPVYYFILPTINYPLSTIN